uniref:Uncharacterized protein n=1 Tax=Anguilla anguilla TaxID=7936 RepID=A0A0E9RGA5_ANGAN
MVLVLLFMSLHVSLCPSPHFSYPLGESWVPV